MSNETFTQKELTELRQACTWATLFWDEESQKIGANEEVCRRIKRQYLALWERVEAVRQAQESSLPTLVG